MRGSLDQMSSLTSKTLTGWLRERSDAELAALFAARPDLVSPVPSDVAALALRAVSRPSVHSALDRLDRLTLQVLDAFTALPRPTTFTALAAVLGDAATVRSTVDRLRALALVYGEDDALNVPNVLHERTGDASGLGRSANVLLAAMPRRRLDQLVADLALPPVDNTAAAVESVTALLSDPGHLDRLLQTAPAGARDVLDLLTWGPPVGNVEDAARPVTAATADSPVRWLIAHGLLVAVSAGTVELVREVGLHLRGGRLYAELATTAPPLAVTSHTPASVDRAAAGQAFTFVRMTEDLLEAWGIDPPAALRAGGLSVRDLRRVTQSLDIEVHAAALLVETAYAAGLLAPDVALDGSWVPTTAYDLWRTQPAQDRWVTLATAWLGNTRIAGGVGERDLTGANRDKLNALGPDLERAYAPQVRHAVLGTLSELAPGSAATTASLLEHLAWQAPRRATPARTRIVGWTLAEAELLGVTGRGALASPGRALVRGGSDPHALDLAADALAPLLPTPVDHVLLQADLTAVAPGPLETTLARSLGLIADIESTGGATVYRFSEASVRRGLDAGQSAADLHALLATHSRTPVPQPLTYLIDDVARKHGRIRVGVASAYIRCDDESILTELLADRRSAPLRLRRIVPSVAMSQLPVDLVLARLREMGYSPAAESADGAVLIMRPDARRVTPRARPYRPASEATSGPPNEKLLNAAVRALRAGERASSGSRNGETAEPGGSGDLPAGTSADTLAALRAAAAEGRPVWIGYVNAQGQASKRIVEPLQVEGGMFTAFDHRRDEVRTFAIHRITGLADVSGTD